MARENQYKSLHRKVLELICPSIWDTSMKRETYSYNQQFGLFLNHLLVFLLTYVQLNFGVFQREVECIVNCMFLWNFINNVAH